METMVTSQDLMDTMVTSQELMVTTVTSQELIVTTVTSQDVHSGADLRHVLALRTEMLRFQLRRATVRNYTQNQ